MKKHILIFLIALIHFDYCISQQAINLSKNYLPNSEYIVEYSFSNENEMKYNEPIEFIEYLKSQGVKNPTFEKENYELKSKSKTGKISDNGFPVEIKIIKFTNDDYKGTKVYGKTINGKSEFNSIKSSKLNKQQEQELLNSINAVFNIEQPKDILTLNKTVESTILRKIPFTEDLLINLIVKTSYFFERIENGIGYIKVNVEYDLGSENQKELEIDLNNSKGNGFIEYDLKNKYSRKYFLDVFINAKIKIEEMEMELKQKSEITQKINKEK